MKNVFGVFCLFLISSSLSAQEGVKIGFRASPLIAFNQSNSTIEWEDIKTKISQQRVVSLEYLLFAGERATPFKGTADEIERRVRAAAAKTECSINLKQIMLNMEGEFRNEDGSPFEVEQNGTVQFKAQTVFTEGTSIWETETRSIYVKIEGVGGDVSVGASPDKKINCVRFFVIPN